MKNNYTSLKSPLDEEDELKTDHEIDLEKGPLPEYDSEEEGALPPYSDHALVNNPPNTHRENHSSGTTDNSSPLLIKLLISFTSIILFNAPAVCYLKYKDAFFKNYGAVEWTLFGFWCFVCTLALIFLTYFYETWTKAVKVTVISLAQCVKVTAVFLAKCVKVTAVGLYNSREKWVVIIWLLWVVICYTLFLRAKFGNLNLDKALICSTCSISAALLLFLLYVRLPFWTLKHMFSGLFQVLGVQSCVVIVQKGLMHLFDKHIDGTGYEIEASSLFVIGNFLFFYEMECPGALKRMPKFIRNGIASFLGGIANAIGGANDNNDIPLEETEAESEV
ncbi:wtf antidote-like meiotic drive suppressor Wtf9 [Schizosaccharomyces pombe]|uniref:Meiotic drive suppressor wtf9 n=1 Tax=Schizosaccharomyces pombe (strain 972 / ATCC 24843) TaxID=284812 RepID=WTF9_SCHPO|nr:wtf element Wtf9 [Schizosaccharomyces pombe]O74564.1 RecName: Full=Meiotic drive suppressor wtf9 [Schizosaccharomyces pombe 972h-]CAA20704.1 wtf element Wtf9 [Schizosaccharomyces pombe]|eukprot:NP_587844.1 wtf element Wtf9 [Schizosaccharomyces pombe]